MLHNAELVGFAEGTPVLMADGKWKPIEQVKQGDWVMSFNHKAEGYPLEPKQVINTLSAIHGDCVEVWAGDKVTIVAKDQLFFTPGATWSPSYETKKVIDFSGNIQDIQVRKVRKGKWKLFDITVEENHSLIANDLRVHNGGGSNKKKKVYPPPQPVVTAGRPGRPVSVTVSNQQGVSTTVTVNPSPGSAAQVGVAYNGAINIRQNDVPGVGIYDYSAPYQPVVILPYPNSSTAYDRAQNAEILKNNVCDLMLSKGNNYKVTRADEIAWEADLDAMIRELNSIKALKLPAARTRQTVCTQSYPPRCRDTWLTSDPSVVNDAVSAAQQLKREIRAGKKLTQSFVEQNCNKIGSIISAIKGSVGNRPNVAICYTVPQTNVVITPDPSHYHTDRIYDDSANYAYIVRKGTSCAFMYDPPNAPAITNVLYYKHCDPTSNRYYYDRVSDSATCSTFG